MQYLEEHGFLHRNLAARNILVNDQHNTFKIGDFCLATTDINKIEPGTRYSGNAATAALQYF